MRSQWMTLLGMVLLAVSLMALACGGGSAPTTAPAPQQPASPAQPAPAAQAPEPQPASPSSPSPATAVQIPSGSVSEPKRGGIAVIAHRGDPAAGFDHMRTVGINLEGFAAPLASDGNLVTGCRENVYLVCPNLAEKWEHNSDFTQWTFKIRDGVVWHDGQPFTAEDAQFWVELAYFGIQKEGKTRLPATFRVAFGELESVQTLDGNRVRLTLKQPHPTFLETIMNPKYKTLHPKHLMQPRIDRGEVDVAPLDVGLVGTGPFKVQKYEKGVGLQVRRFDRYWERDQQARVLPFLDGIDFPVIRDPGAMDAAFRVGRLDGGARAGGFVLTRERKAGYERDLGEKVWFAEIPSGGLFSLDYNVLKRGPWQDVRVRRATALWMDKAASIEALGGFGVVAPILGLNSPFTDPNFTQWPGFNPKTREQDRAEAKRLLVEAGYPRGFEMGHLCRRTYLDKCVLIEGQLAGLNISLKIQVVDDAPWLRGCASLDFDTGQCVFAGSSIPEAWESSQTRASLSPQAHFKHEDPRIPAFYDRLRRSFTLDDRIKVWRELEAYIIAEQVYMVPFANPTNVVPYRSHLRGVAVPQIDVLKNNDFATAWLDR